MVGITMGFLFCCMIFETDFDNFETVESDIGIHFGSLKLAEGRLADKAWAGVVLLKLIRISLRVVDVFDEAEEPGRYSCIVIIFRFA